MIESVKHNSLVLLFVGLALATAVTIVSQSYWGAFVLVVLLNIGVGFLLYHLLKRLFLRIDQGLESSDSDSELVPAKEHLTDNVCEANANDVPSDASALAQDDSPLVLETQSPKPTSTEFSFESPLENHLMQELVEQEDDSEQKEKEESGKASNQAQHLHRRSTDRKVLSILVPDVDEEDAESFSVGEFLRRLEEITVNFVDVVLLIYKRSNSAVNRTDKVFEQVDQTYEMLDTVKYSADETHLIALNTLVEAALAGQAGHGTGLMATEVEKLAKQAHKFGEGVRRDVDIAKRTIDEVRTLISKTADKELKVTLSLNRQIDQALGKMVAIEKQIRKLDSSAVPDVRVACDDLFNSASDSLMIIKNSLRSLVGRTELIISKQGLSKEEAEIVGPFMIFAKLVDSASLELAE